MKLLISAFLLCIIAAFGYERLQGPTELLFSNKEKAFSGYTLFGVGSRTYLLDMAGNVVHTWPVGTNPHLLENGHVLDASKDDPSGFQGFQEVDWDGKIVWEYTEKREGYAPHHDWVRIFNKALNAPCTLYIANKSITNDQAIAAGADPKMGPYREGQMDAIVEVDMQGKVVWEWWFFDHVIQDIDPAKPNHVGPGKTIADHPGRINLNMPGKPLKRDWLHCNSLDYNAESGHLVINSVQGEMYVIDHDGTFVAGDATAGIAKAASLAGDFLYRFGDPARYKQGDPPRVLENWDSATSGHKQLGGAHDAHWIRPGLPGAGHLMVFNNGQYLYQRTPQSSILEINPFLDASGRDTGKYVNPPLAGYKRETYDHDTHNEPRQISNQIVWAFRSVNSHNFFSHIGSSGQRLPNGVVRLGHEHERCLFLHAADDVRLDGATLAVAGRSLVAQDVLHGRVQQPARAQVALGEVEAADELVDGAHSCRQTVVKDKLFVRERLDDGVASNDGRPCKEHVQNDASVHGHFPSVIHSDSQMVFFVQAKDAQALSCELFQSLSKYRLRPLAQQVELQRPVAQQVFRVRPAVRVVQEKVVVAPPTVRLSVVEARVPVNPLHLAVRRDLEEVVVVGRRRDDRGAEALPGIERQKTGLG